MLGLSPMVWRRLCWNPIANTEPHLEVYAYTLGLISSLILAKFGEKSHGKLFTFGDLFDCH